MKNLLFLLFAFGLFFSCNNAPGGPATETPDVSTPGYKHFGAAITADNALSYGELLTQMEGKDSFPSKFIANVNAVCKKKGCWASVATEEGQPEMFVRFKDYGFFLPTDCDGQQVILEGYAFKEVTSVDELRHYAEDEGKSKEEIEAITEPKEELKFLASGAMLKDK